MLHLKKQYGFTLIELLLVIAIIGILSSIALTSLNHARKKARDARRLNNVKQIQIALELYKETYGHYPANSDNDTGGWDVGNINLQRNGDIFIKPLEDANLMKQVPVDPSAAGIRGYLYYRYHAGSFGCDINRGDYYVLGVSDMESSTGKHPASPGWTCGDRDWHNAAGLEWVAGGFTK